MPTPLTDERDQAKNAMKALSRLFSLSNGNRFDYWSEEEHWSEEDADGDFYDTQQFADQAVAWLDPEDTSKAWFTMWSSPSGWDFQGNHDEEFDKELHGKLLEAAKRLQASPRKPRSEITQPNELLAIAIIHRSNELLKVLDGSPPIDSLVDTPTILLRKLSKHLAAAFHKCDGPLTVHSKLLGDFIDFLDDRLNLCTPGEEPDPVDMKSMLDLLHNFTILFSLEKKWDSKNTSKQTIINEMLRDIERAMYDDPTKSTELREPYAPYVTATPNLRPLSQDELNDIATALNEDVPPHLTINGKTFQRDAHFDEGTSLTITYTSAKTSDPAVSHKTLIKQDESGNLTAYYQPSNDEDKKTSSEERIQFSTYALLDIQTKKAKHIPEEISFNMPANFLQKAGKEETVRDWIKDYLESQMKVSEKFEISLTINGHTANLALAGQYDPSSSMEGDFKEDDHDGASLETHRSGIGGTGGRNG